MAVIGISCAQRSLDTVIARAERHHLLSATYVDAVAAAGATPVILPVLDPGEAGEVVSRLDGLLVSGGGDIDPGRYGHRTTASTDIDPDRDGWELALVDAAGTAGLPVLGICRGVQILAVAGGGTLRQHVWGTDDHLHLSNGDETFLSSGHHDVELSGALAELYGKDRRTVNSLHHQAIDRVPAGYEVVATAPDGVVEGIASQAAIGVQWHPERLDLADEQPLFEWLTANAEAVRP